MTAAEVIQLLDQTVDWYRTLGAQQQAANEPSDLLFLYDDRQTAAKVMSLAFDVARADADALAKSTAPADDTGASTGTGVSKATVAQFRAALEAQQLSAHTQLDAERRALAAAPRRERVGLQAKINELESVLDLLDSKQALLNTMTDVMNGANAGAESLKAQIDAMAVAIPSGSTALAAAAPSAAPSSGASAAAAPAASAASVFASTVTPGNAIDRFGLWDLAANAFRLSQKAGTLASIARRTAALEDALGQIRAPLIEQIKGLSTRGDTLSAQAVSADSTTLNGIHEALDALAGQFKEASAVLLPLSHEIVLLRQYQRNLHNWHNAVEAQYRDSLETLAIRVGLVLTVLAIVFAAAEFWRRMVLRYVQDFRRRNQLLLLRRIAVWSLVVIVVGVAFASELGSIVTFAGLITAGIAVAMQSVLVSIVGYFFLIGKYGIRVGDRVQIGEVTGEVIDLGLVRMYLMELGAKGTLGPTGRVVAFANSVVFQVSSGLFKQIPGVNISWREVVLGLPAGANYPVIKERLAAAVVHALADFRDEIERQTQELARTTQSGSAGDVKPQVQLQFTVAGVEAHVRYPVHRKDAAEIDERVTEALARVISDVATGTGTGAASTATTATVPARE